MTLVVDASVVVAAMVDGGPAGQWSEQLLASDDLIAPHLMPAEAAHVLRRAALAGDISGDVGSMAYSDLLDLRIELFPYGPFADRIWELRGGLTPYDAWYVALAELLGAHLATLDGRLSRTPHARCDFITPP